MKGLKIILALILISVVVQFLCCTQNVVAEKSKPETASIKIAVWGFHYLDLDSRSMCKYLIGDFSEIAKNNPDIEVISSKKVNKTRGKVKMEELGKEIVLELAKKAEADISIWGQVSQIEPRLYFVNFFILDTRTGDIKFQRLQVGKKKEKRLKSVTSIVNQAIELKKSAEDKAMAIALNFFHSEQYEDAKNAFLDVLHINPNEKTAYNYLAYIAAIDEDYEIAISYYQKALEIDPDHVAALEGLVWAYKVNEDYDKAIEIYERLTSIDPDNIEYWYSLGEIYQTEEDFKDAIDTYQSVLRRDSTCIKAHKAVGLLYFENNFYDEAIPHLKSVLDAGLEESEVEKKLAIAYQKTGRTEESIQQNLDILKKDSTRTVPYINLAAVYATQQRFDDALNALKKYISLEPNSPIGYNRISDVYRQMKNYDEAIANAKKSAEIAPNKPEPYLLLGEVDNERGYEHYQKFVEYDEKAKNPDLSTQYEENNRLRGINKKQAQAFFVSTKEYFKKANSLSTDFFMKERLKEKLATVDLLIEETKFDKFYDEY
jgi:tetratricopeptide (TPR) repeat protein